MTADRENQGIALREGVTGGRALWGALKAAAASDSEAFSGLALPDDVAAFKASYAELLPAFEALRVQSGQAAALARHAYMHVVGQLRYVDAAGERPLVEALTESAAPLPLARVELPGPGRFMPSVDFGGKLYVGGELANLTEQLLQSRFVTHAAASALGELAARAERDGGLSLRGERFVLLGAGAELSPVYALLEAGADVLWLDRKRPPVDRLLEPRLGGSLSYVEGGVDLLQQPAALRATLARFTAEGPAHFGLYAFATGSACPLRLAFAMNELVRSLPLASVRSMAFLLSPTSVNFVAPEDAARADERAARSGKMSRALLRAGTLQRSWLPAGDLHISRAVVPARGAAYQAAEYVGKRLAAEAFAAFGPTLTATRAPRSFFVSANMAPVTATRSLESPMLEAAVVGAPSLEMLIAKPSTARAVSALLLVHDVLSGHDGARPLFARQFHGGVHAQAYALESIIRMAALRGVAQRPKLALEFLR